MTHLSSETVEISATNKSATIIPPDHDLSTPEVFWTLRCYFLPETGSFEVRTRASLSVCTRSPRCRPCFRPHLQQLHSFQRGEREESELAAHSASGRVSRGQDQVATSIADCAAGPDRVWLEPRIALLV